jgi:hypothetical protein
MTGWQRTFQRVMESAAEHDGERRAQRRNFLSRTAAVCGIDFFTIISSIQF